MWIAAAYRQTHSPSRLAWSEGRQLINTDTGIIGTACTICRAGSMKQYTVRQSDRLFVPAQATAANVAALAWLAGDIDRLLHSKQQRSSECK